MKRIFTILSILVFCSSWTVKNQYEVCKEKGWSSTVVSNASDTYVFEIMERQDFLDMSPRLTSCHIGQLQSLNPEINLREVNASYDFSRLKFLHNPDQSMAYGLYSGKFLIVRPNVESK